MGGKSQFCLREYSRKLTRIQLLSTSAGEGACAAAAGMTVVSLELAAGTAAAGAGAGTGAGAGAMAFMNASIWNSVIFTISSAFFAWWRGIFFKRSVDIMP